jgi:hypothetical protein
MTARKDNPSTPRVRWLLALCGSLLMVLAATGGVAKAKKHDTVTIPLSWHFTGQINPIPTNVSCGGPTICVLTYNAVVNHQGPSVIGTEQLVIQEYGDLGSMTFKYSGGSSFTGTIVGCGTGSGKNKVTNGSVSGNFDVAAGGFPAQDDFMAVPGSETGGLAGVVAASGHNTFVVHPDFSIVGDGTGTVTCGRTR